MTASDFVRRALADALALLIPVTCAGCDAPDAALCDTCGPGLRPRIIARTIAGVPVRAGVSYDGVVARSIRALKEDGRVGLARAFAPALAAAAEPWDDCVFVPVPTSRRSFRRRGFHVADLVARRAGLRVARLLRYSRQPDDQRGLGIDARRANVEESMAARAGGGGRVVLLDDVVTTGATIGEAIRAARTGGFDVLGAVAIAATPRRDAMSRPFRDAPENGR
ncbi:ComF family protein [Microbacterium koreense]|uniref:ComF family protein n=1 Tax=Microbacterium koreense TaxID=323761 RepID=A0ABW2ZTQ9_9MICO